MNRLAVTALLLASACAEHEREPEKVPGAVTALVATVVEGTFAETIDALLSRMSDRRIRHLPVCHGGRLIGIVSIGDLVKWKISEVEAEADGLKAYIAAS